MRSSAPTNFFHYPIARVGQTINHAFWETQLYDSVAGIQTFGGSPPTSGNQSRSTKRQTIRGILGFEPGGPQGQNSSRPGGAVGGEPG